MPRSVGAIVLAAGLGTRMRSRRAKVLHELGGRPLITYPLEALRSLGVEPIVVVVGHQAEAVEAVCTPYRARFALQTEQRGTGHAALAAAAALPGFTGDLLLLYGDLPFVRTETLQRLVQTHQEAGAAVSLLTEVVPDPGEFGRIVRDEDGHVARIVEHRDASAAERALHEVNVGVYCADAAFLFRTLPQLDSRNIQGELYLTDIIALARAQGVGIAAATATPGEGAQISSRVDLALLEARLRDEINARWMTAGVTLDDPATTLIGPDVVLGQDTRIGPNVVLRGKTEIGRGCQLDGSARLIDAHVGNDVHIKFGVVITESRVDDGAVVGPFAQLRPGTHLGAGVHIGDFVETKNAILGPGVKANHHAYLGDAEIGAGTNVGAGTITCNYDGFRKARTVVGARVQIGSDSQLVAPVTIGDDAYIATGTTVRKDVPPGALVFNPKPQMHRDGWVSTRQRRETEGGDAPRPERKTKPPRRAARTPPSSRKRARARASTSRKKRVTRR